MTLPLDDPTESCPSQRLLGQPRQHMMDMQQSESEGSTLPPQSISLPSMDMRTASTGKHNIEMPETGLPKRPRLESSCSSKEYWQNGETSCQEPRTTIRDPSLSAAMEDDDISDMVDTAISREQLRLFEQTQAEDRDVRKRSKIAEMRARLQGAGNHRSLSANSIAHYAPHLVDFEMFCDKEYEGNYSVEPEKVVAFLTKKIFTRRRIIVIKLREGYSGLIGVRGHDPKSNDPAEVTKAKEEEMEIRTEFGRAVEVDPGEDEPEPENIDDDPTGGTDTIDDSSPDGKFAPPRIQSSECDVSSECRYIIPMGKETVEAVLKALTFLWETQHQDLDHPNTSPKPRKSLLVQEARDSYYRRLVFGTVSPWPDRGVSCASRDEYTVADFLKMMVVLWKGFDTWDRRTPLIRDRMSINLRHQAFFRDDSLRIMALSDCFRQSIHTKFDGTTSKVHGLAFCLRAGKIQPNFKTDFAMVLRHKNYMRCGVGATAFYLFERFHLREEDVPNSNDISQWNKIKLVVGEDRTRDIDYSTQWRSMKGAFALCEIRSGCGTDSGSHCAALELQSMGLAIDHPARVGRWAHNNLQSYMSLLGFPGAFAMAGFHNERYRLARDCLTPPLELQRLVFPWIEDQCTEDNRAAWRKKCDEIMKDKPESISSVIEEIYNTVKAEQDEEEQQTEQAIKKYSNKDQRQSQKQTQEPKRRVASYSDIAKEGFLCLLVWLRRVILQDAVMFLRDGASNHLLEHPTFKHPLFREYSVSLEDAVASNLRTQLNADGAMDLSSTSQSSQSLQVEQGNHLATLLQAQQNFEEAVRTTVHVSVEQQFENLTQAIIPVIQEMLYANQQILQAGGKVAQLMECIVQATQLAIDRSTSAQRPAGLDTSPVAATMTQVPGTIPQELVQTSQTPGAPANPTPPTEPAVPGTLSLPRTTGVKSQKEYRFDENYPVAMAVQELQDEQGRCNEIVFQFI
ncbi:hypothetical protein EMPS_09926 [Entomortierella parvispora]|uniref:Ndc10 domain-containing protein n=1 Tax=Entomortierella parvispora TaxID=205924 RepID=A0A9P3HJS2_9FUNG|nr:hypothetical protein EMPS_09926 [Entomortierella parvispora]